jgi:hypothetical protein
VVLADDQSQLFGITTHTLVFDSKKALVEQLLGVVGVLRIDNNLCFKLGE